MKTRLSPLLLLASLGCATVPRAPVPADAVVAGARVRILSSREAADFLRNPDEFTRAWSPFDRSLRMRRATPVGDEELRAFAAAQAEDFSAEERERWTAALRALDAALAGARLELPAEILLIKTSGQEEPGEAYTRRNAIIVTRKAAAEPGTPIGLAAHELFHILSRHSEATRRATYALLGFRPHAAAALPAELAARRLTNPDAVGPSFAIEVTRGDGSRVLGVPMLVSSLSLEDILGGASWFSGLKVVLVEPPEGAGQPRVVHADETDWPRRVARNTGYAIHPDEVLADNFALLVHRRRGSPRPITDVAFLDRLEVTLLGADPPEP